VPNRTIKIIMPNGTIKSIIPIDGDVQIML